MDDEKDRYWNPDGPGGKHAMRAAPMCIDSKRYKTDPNRIYLTSDSKCKSRRGNARYDRVHRTDSS